MPCCSASRMLLSLRIRLRRFQFSREMPCDGIQPINEQIPVKFRSSIVSIVESVRCWKKAVACCQFFSVYRVNVWVTDSIYTCTNEADLIPHRCCVTSLWLVLPELRFSYMRSLTSRECHVWLSFLTNEQPVRGNWSHLPAAKQLTYTTLLAMLHNVS